MKLLFIILIIPFIFSCTQKERHKPDNNKFQNPGTPPDNCIEWFDGCNTCRTEGSQILSCTEMVCFVMQAPRCLRFQNGPSKHELRKKSCRDNNGVWQRKMNGAWICMDKTTDANFPCDTSKECQGVCLYYKGKTRGFCSRHTPFVGCAQEYENGKHFKICE